MSGIKSFLVLLSFTFLFQYEVESSNTLNFVKAKGDVVLLPGGGRYPRGGVIMNCVGRCKRTDGCICLRVSTDGNDTCETFTPATEANGLDSNGFIYFSIDKLQETINSPSVALKKPSLQSSFYQLKGVQFTADRAVDGKRNTDGLAAPYLASTNDQPADTFPWWQVDLVSQHFITGITILNRKKFPDRLHDLEIRVGNNPIPPNGGFSDVHFKDNPLCAEHIGAGIGEEQTRTFVCAPCPVKGRYVSIQIVRNCSNCTVPNVNILNLAEVDVHGFETQEEAN